MFINKGTLTGRCVCLLVAGKVKKQGGVVVVMEERKRRKKKEEEEEDGTGGDTWQYQRSY